MDTAYDTAYKACNKIKEAIYQFVKEDGMLSEEAQMGESSFADKRAGKRGRGAEGKIPVFGLLEREGRVKVEVVRRILKETIKKVKRGSIIYTDRLRSYDGLVMHGFKHERIDHGKKFANGKVYTNGIEGFWSYAKERLMKFHGVCKEKFVYYLKELEFRHNNRGNLNEVIYECLSAKRVGGKF